MVRLLPAQPAWAIAAFGTLLRERGSFGLGPHDLRLNAGDVRRLAPVLDPVLRAWRHRERDHEIAAFAAMVDRRLRHWPTLLDLLAGIVETSRHEYVSTRALAVIARHDRRRFAALVPDLLRRDRSWIVQHQVHLHLHRVRQDLLDPYLGHAAPKGRFATGRTRFVLPMRAGFWRWLPAQQAAFARTLDGLAGDPDRDVPTVLHALDRLAALPDVPPGRLRALAGADEPHLAVRDEALRALARRDGGDGLDLLVAALGDGRARIAVYVLAGALRDLPDARVMPLLRAAPRQRVTVFKEIVRLAGAQPGAAGFAFLREIEAGDGAAPLHRDVRLALLRALWDHLERDAAWPILARAAAADPDPVVAASLARIPADRLSPAAADRLADRLAGLAGHPDPEVRVAVLRRLAATPLADRREVLVGPVLRALASSLPDESAAAARAVVASRAGRRPEALGAAVAGLRENRRALAALRDALLDWLSLRRALALAGLCLLPAAAAGRSPTPHDLCREMPPAAAKECRAAADLLMEPTRPPPADLTVRVTAGADGLRYRYEGPGPSGEGEGCDGVGALALPVGRRVRLLVTSGDAIYALRVPGLGLAADLIPGRINEVRLDPVRAGPALLRGVLNNAIGGRDGAVTVRLVGDGRETVALRSLCGG
ncbi:MAG: hypothetical protein PGN34_00325 [Methylobacterium frigidaeris]